jgi:hypothetical protein
MLTFSGITEIYKKVFIQEENQNPFSYIGIGLGKSPPTLQDTSLEYEIDRVKCNINHIPLSKSIRLTATFPSGISSGQISEIGVFNTNDITATMLARQLLKPSRYKSKSQPFTVIWRFSF